MNEMGFNKSPIPINSFEVDSRKLGFKMLYMAQKIEFCIKLVENKDVL